MSIQDSVQSIPVFVINLRKDAEKRRHMQLQAEKLGLTFTFIDAVYGKELAEAEVKRVTDDAKTIREMKRPLFRGEIGVALSQMSIYKKMIDEGIENAIIFEDDVDIDPSILELLECADNLPQDWQVMLLGYHRNFPQNRYHRISFRQRTRISERFKAVRFTEMMHGAYGYMINRAGAQRLLDTLQRGIVLPVDHYTGSSDAVNLYGLLPQCVKINDQMQGLSTINEERFPHHRKSRAKGYGISWKGRLKQRLDDAGLLELVVKMNYYRAKYQGELAVLPKRMKKPKEYR